MPSSKDRRRIEVPTTFYDRLKQIAEAEERPITGVLFDLLQIGLANYHSTWMPRFFMDRFNDGARRALALAKEEARQLHHNYIGTEHLLLGLLREEEGIAAQALRQLWIELDKTRAGVVYITTKGKQTFAPTVALPDADDEIDYTMRARKVLALAVDEAQRLGHDYVGTEHLLLALVREGEGIAAGLLQTFGALGKAREFTLALLNQRAASGQAEPASGSSPTEALAEPA